GIVPAILFLVGGYVTLLTPARERLAWLATSAAHLTIVFAFLVFHVGQPNLYERAWMHGMLTMSFTAAWGLHWARMQVAARSRSRWTAPAALALAFIVLFATTSTAQAAREGDYYHVITEGQAQDLVWIR